jgi:ABC-type branched-subunit amino acid transport system permease subunit
MKLGIQAKLVTLFAWTKRGAICYAKGMRRYSVQNGVQLLTPFAGIISAPTGVLQGYTVLRLQYAWHYVGSWEASEVFTIFLGGVYKHEAMH